MEHCLDCSKKLSGRLDKKFCDDYCRGHYHNQLNKDKNASLKEVNRILRKNASILQKFEENGLRAMNRKILLAAGFDFNFFTHQVYGEAGECYQCCYNYGYSIVNEDELILKVFQHQHTVKDER